MSTYRVQLPRVNDHASPSMRYLLAVMVDAGGDGASADHLASRVDAVAPHTFGWIAVERCAALGLVAARGGRAWVTPAGRRAHRAGVAGQAVDGAPRSDSSHARGHAGRGEAVAS